ncbi:MAG: hypothetical protein AAGI01_01465, partial [Myxococcota bacterium]
VALVAWLGWSPAANAQDAEPTRDLANEPSTPDTSPASTTEHASSPGLDVKQAFEAANPAKVGEPMTMTIEVSHPAGATVTAPGATGNPRWGIADAEIVTSQAAEGRSTSTITLKLVVYRPGLTTLESMSVGVLTADGDLLSARTKPVQAKVVSQLGDDAELRAPEGPLSVFAEDYAPLWVALGAASVSLTALLTFFLVRRLVREDAPPPPPTPIHVVALEKLSKLAAGELAEREDFLRFYIQLSEAIREYLGRRYGFPGVELTTTEVMDRLRMVRWPQGLATDDVREWLDGCDRVKFTNFTPEQSAAERDLRVAFTIVELTRTHEEAHAGADAPTAIESDIDPERTEAPLDPTEGARDMVDTTAMGQMNFEEVRAITRRAMRDTTIEDRTGEQE